MSDGAHRAEVPESVVRGRRLVLGAEELGERRRSRRRIDLRQLDPAHPASAGLGAGPFERERLSSALLVSVLEHDRDRAGRAAPLEAQPIRGERPDGSSALVERAQHDRAR